jgi:membrane protease YdiL (CAAX protease family)
MDECPIPPTFRREVVTEICVVIALGILHPVAGVVASRMGDGTGSTSRNVPRSLYSIVLAVQVIVPLLWIMQRSGRSWRFFGLPPFQWRLDVVIAPLLSLLLLSVSWAAGWAIYAIMWTVPRASELIMFVNPNERSMTAVHAFPSSATEWIAFAVYQAANGVAEELVLRGYLLTRIRELTERPMLSILLVSALAAAYHLYQGSYAGLVVFCGEIVLGIVYLKYPRVVPFAIGHALYDVFLTVRRASGLM